MKKPLKVIIVCMGLTIAALLTYQIVDYATMIDMEDIKNMSEEELETLTLSKKNFMYLWTYVDETYHPFKDFDEYRDDYMVMVEIIKRNMDALEASGSNVVIWYGSPSNTRIEARKGEFWEISEREKESVCRLDYLYRGWSSVMAYESYIWFHSEDGVYELAYSLDGNPPPTVHAKNGAEYYKPIDLGGGWYALSMKVE